MQMQGLRSEFPIVVSYFIRDHSKIPIPCIPGIPGLPAAFYHFLMDVPGVTHAVMSSQKV